MKPEFFKQCAATAHHLQQIVGLEQIMKDLYLYHANQAAHVFDEKRKKFHKDVADKLGQYFNDLPTQPQEKI